MPSGGAPIAVEPFGHGPRDLPAALGRHRGIEPRVEHPGPAGALDHPDEVGERLQDVVRIAQDVVLVGLAVVVRVAHRIDLVDVLHHLKTRPRVSGPSQIIIAAMPDSTMATLIALTMTNPWSRRNPSTVGIVAPMAAAAW